MRDKDRTLPHDPDAPHVTPRPNTDPGADPEAYEEIPPPHHRLQLAPAPSSDSNGSPSRSAPPVKQGPSRPDRSIPWDDIRRLFVKGIATGPGLPDRTEILELVGEADALIRDRHYGRRAAVKVGKYRVVFPSLQGVASYFGLSWKLVRTRSNAEGWADLQQIYRAQLQQKHAQAKTRQRLAQVEQIDRRAHATAKLGLKMVEERLIMLTTTMELADGEMRIMVDPREMDSLAKAAQTFHALGRRALGFPVDQVGAMKAQDAVELAGFGLASLGGVEDAEDVVEAESLSPQTRFDANLVGEVGSGMVDEKPSIATELAKDDAERLHGFLTVLGRAQEASQQEDDEAAGTAEGDGQHGELSAPGRGEIGAGVGSA